MADRTFMQLIEKEFGGTTSVPAVSKKYPNFKRLKVNQKIMVAKEDVQNFQKLFTVKPTGNVGNGEVAFFYLYNYYSKTPLLSKKFNGQERPTKLRAHESHSGGSADLRIDDVNVEVKSYTKGINVPIKLGAFLRFKKFREAINILFTVDNLINVRSTSVDLQNFDFKKMETAAESLCNLRSVLNDPKNKKVLKDMEFIKNIRTLIAKFDKTLEDIGLKDCTFNESGDQIGGKTIALKLSLYIFEKMFSEKPGDDGYLINFPEKAQGVFDENEGVRVNQVAFDNIGKDGIDAIQDTSKKSFYFSYGNFFFSVGRILT